MAFPATPFRLDNFDDFLQQPENEINDESRRTGIDVVQISVSLGGHRLSLVGAVALDWHGDIAIHASLNLIITHPVYHSQTTLIFSVLSKGKLSWHHL